MLEHKGKRVVKATCDYFHVFVRSGFGRGGVEICDRLLLDPKQSSSDQTVSFNLTSRIPAKKESGTVVDY